MNLFSKSFEFFAVEGTFSYGELKLTPIHCPTPAPDNIKGFDELFDQQKAFARELDQSASVTEINLENNSPHYLLLLDGEAIVGAKQNRITQKSLIVKPRSSQTIPVNCVEQGRWRYDGDIGFTKSSFSAGPRMREAKISMLKMNLASEVQNVVWDEIQEVSVRIKSHSATGDLGEILNKKRHLAEQEYRDFIGRQACNGYLVEGAGKPYFEIFSNAQICKHHMKKILRSLLSDCDSEEKQIAGDYKKDTYINTLFGHYSQQLKDAQWETDSQVGIEDAVISIGKDNGRAIFLNGFFVHGYMSLEEPLNV